MPADTQDRGGPGKDRSSLASAMRKAGPYLNIGWAFVTPIALGLAIGWYLDRRFGWDPWAKLVGMLLGIASGFVNFFSVVLRLGRKGPRNGGGGER